ncbi:MAG: type secretion system lysozyme-related protein [Gammaproteobacteria bacterium]|jgi:type VI secretion system protein ImpF|nr:type secretion system lysozyme-related protein [Gammaproteobacteria bacterium]
MAELLPQERLQPSLLDRLTDNAPDTRTESREARVLNLTQLRASVMRDVAWLLNTVNLAASQDFGSCREAEHSTINYGIPDLAGSSAAGRNAKELERAVRQALIDFEPRILRDTVRVSVRVQPDRMSRHALTFIIEGDLWAQPVPLSIYLKTEVDLETGTVTVTDKA